MAGSLPRLMNDLIEKGEKVENCLELFKSMQAAERGERAAEREMRKAEMEKEVKLRELELREKEMAQGIAQPQSHSYSNLKS